MTTHSLRYSSKSRPSSAEFEHQVSELSAALKEPLNGQLTKVEQRIRDLETRYEMSSSTMLSRYNDGEIRETSDICTWLMLLGVRNHANSKPTSS